LKARRGKIRKLDPALAGDADLIVDTIYDVAKALDVKWVAASTSVIAYRASRHKAPPFKKTHIACMVPKRNTIYISLPQWRQLVDDGKRAVIAHEMCHLATVLTARVAEKNHHNVDFWTAMATAGYLLKEIEHIHGMAPGTERYNKIKTILRRNGYIS
jgi:hypothetical protein